MANIAEPAMGGQGIDTAGGNQSSLQATSVGGRFCHWTLSVRNALFSVPASTSTILPEVDAS